MTLHSISPSEARNLMQAGAVLVDIREKDERARECIPGAQHRALSAIGTSTIDGHRPVIFHCRSGARTATNAGRLEAMVTSKAYLLAGGMDAWKKAGFPTVRDTRQPIEIMRQVQITAGSLVLLGVGLGAIISPAFYAVSAFVGAGLAIAGITGTCAMARLLALAPWNRRSTGPAPI